MTDYKDYNETDFPDIPDAISEIAYSDFKGAFPDVPFAPGVNPDELTAGDGEPFFITLPIAEVGMVSANKLKYTREFCQSLVEQINTDKPTGIRGHIRDDERRYAYPEPAVFWVGATLDADKVWAKGYVPPGATREEYRIKKATGAPAATSIYGKPLKVMAHGDGTYTPILSLEQVDLAPHKRAAHGKGYTFAVTRELETKEETKPMDKTIKEMTAAELSAALDPAVVAELVELHARPAAEAAPDPVIAEMKQAVTERDATIAELEQQVTAQQTALSGLRAQIADHAVQSSIEAATPWHVKSDEGQQRLAELRGLLKSAAIAELADDFSDEAIKGAVEKAVTSHRLVVELARDAMAGPQALAGAVNNRAAATKEFSDEEAQAARERLGFGF